MPALRAFGYTAWPRDSEIGQAVAALNAAHPTRWRIRFSGDGAGDQPLAATTIWRRPEDAWVPEGLVCPAQTHRTAACATCGLCWNLAMDAMRIVFIGHGMRGRGRLPRMRRAAAPTTNDQQGASP